MSDNNTQTENRATTDNNQSLSSLAKRFLWADSNSAVERVIFWLGVLCVVLFVLDFIVHRHAYAPGEGLPGFYAIVGFVAFTLIVLGASQLRRLILRKEDYYSPNSVDSELYPENELERLNHGDETVISGGGVTGEGATQASGSGIQSTLKNETDQGDST